MKPSHDCSYQPMGGRANGALLEKTERKQKSPLGGPRMTEQPRCHGSFARYIRDPMTQGYRHGGACRSCGTIPRKSSRRPGPFLVVSHYTIWTHEQNPSNTSCDPWPPGQLGPGRLPYRRVCTCVAHGKHYLVQTFVRDKLISLLWQYIFESCAWSARARSPTMQQ